MFQSPDSFRKFQELQSSISERRKTEQIRKIEHDLLQNITKIASNPKIVSKSGDIIEKKGTWVGKLTFKIQAEYANDLRQVDLPIEDCSLPSQTILSSLFQNTKGMREKLSEVIKNEIDQKLASYSVEQTPPVIKREASSTPHAGNQFHEVIQVDKTWLPGTTKVGDILFVDGLKYRVTSGDYKKLSADSDGSFFMLERAYDDAEKNVQPKIVGINL